MTKPIPLTLKQWSCEFIIFLIAHGVWQEYLKKLYSTSYFPDCHISEFLISEWFLDMGPERFLLSTFVFVGISKWDNINQKWVELVNRKKGNFTGNGGEV